MDRCRKIWEIVSFDGGTIDMRAIMDLRERERVMTMRRKLMTSELSVASGLSLERTTVYSPLVIRSVHGLLIL